jgi:hypothetical protein
LDLRRHPRRRLLRRRRRGGRRGRGGRPYARARGRPSPSRGVRLLERLLMGPLVRLVVGLVRLVVPLVVRLVRLVGPVRLARRCGVVSQEGSQRRLRARG